MKVKELLASDIYISGDYKVYRGMYNDGGALLWNTRREAFPGENHPWMEEEIGLIAYDQKGKYLIIEIKD